MDLKFRSIGLYLILMSCTGLQAQQVLIKGRIIDKQNLEPVIAATISAGELQRTISDAEGRFALAVKKLPVTLLVSHVSYGILIVTVAKQTGEVIIRLEPQVNRIPEVRVTAIGNKNQVRILNKKARYTIIDYQFEGPYMWFIGCMDNSPG
ncbi:MAG: carboxypeptidase-like regulatory domain-containing protein, partial [Bacteroidia bacterium]|nr:carboxypeptidase-like regulatory domain-containing protein [Bacteroidia bacterium]